MEGRNKLYNIWLPLKEILLPNELGAVGGCFIGRIIDQIHWKTGTVNLPHFSEKPSCMLGDFYGICFIFIGECCVVKFDSSKGYLLKLVGFIVCVCVSR